MRARLLLCDLTRRISFHLRRFCTSHGNAPTTSTTVYVNPICLQMDQKIFACRSIEEVLTVLVTHRGVFFVHNLITSFKLLLELCSVVDRVDEDFPYHLKIRRVQEDERFQLLLKDLCDYASKFDLESISLVMDCLRSMDYRYYNLIRRLLKRLYDLVISGGEVGDVKVLLKVGSLFCWAGYGDGQSLYAHICGRVLDDIDKLSDVDIVDCVSLYGDMSIYYRDVFNVLGSRRVLTYLRLSSGVSLRDVARIARAYAAHIKGGDERSHEKILLCCGDAIRDRLLNSEGHSVDLIRLEEVGSVVDVFRSFKRARIDHSESICLFSSKVLLPLLEDSLLRRTDLSPYLSHGELAILCECIAYFNIESLVGVIDKVLSLEEDFIEELSELVSIKFFYSVCVFSCLVDRHSYMLRLIARKICRGSSWENCKTQLFWIWLSHRMLFPYLGFPGIQKSFLLQCLREWSLGRGGFHVPCLNDSMMLSTYFQSHGINHEWGVWLPESPFYLDVVLTGSEGEQKKECIMVSPELARNTRRVCGGSVIQMKYIKSRGWHAVKVVSPEMVRGSLITGPLDGFMKTLSLALA